MIEKIFESKVALITGGAGGIGFAVAELLIQKGIAHVILIDTNKNMLEESACKLDSERVHTCILDITKEIEVKNAIKKINEKYKRIDLLVNMAGIAGPSARTENYSFDAFQKVFSVNVFGTFLMMKYCLPFMQKQKSGSIVNACSCSGLMGYKLEIGYGSSKSAVLGMTRNAAAENGSNGVRINCISPGWVHTGMLENILEQYANTDGGYTMETLRNGTMLRPAAPYEIANTVCFLLSKDASYINGANFICDGGKTLE